MRKGLLLLLILLFACGMVSLFIWINRTSLAARFLSNELKVPVSITEIQISKNQALINQLHIGNPPHSKTSTSLAIETINIGASPKDLFGNPLLIEEIEMKNLLVGIEFYSADRKKNNWSAILAQNKNPSMKGRNYLIRKLVLENIRTTLTMADGTVKEIPPLPRLEFHNISSETGFPIADIEKAIFKVMMKEIYKQLGLDLFFQAIDPLIQSIPVAPSIIPFFKK